MVKWPTLIALILAVPVIGFIASEGVQAKYNSQLREVVRAEHPEADPADIAALTIDRLCEEAPADFSEICGTNRNLNIMSKAAIAAAVVGLLLILAIRVAGAIARDNRSSLLKVFKPGLYLTGFVLIVLVIVNGAVAMGAIYYGEAALIGRIHIQIMLGIAIGALVGVFVIARNVFTVIRKASTMVIGKAVTRDEAPELWSRVDDTSTRLGTLKPDNVVLGLDPNFFVTEADVRCLTGEHTGRTLYCSLPLMRILRTDELVGIIGHELGHYKGLDTQFSRQFYPIYRGTANSIAGLQANAEGWQAIALMPAIVLFSFFFESFAVAESRISRERELLADKEGVSATNNRSFATALVKVHAYAGFWGGLQNAAVGALREGKAFINASKTYAHAVAENASPKLFEEIAETRLSHPTDSHPPLGTRLESLGLSIGDVQSESLDVTPSNAAIELLPNVEKTEEEISEAYQAILARSLGITPGAESDAGKSSGQAKPEAAGDSNAPGESNAPEKPSE